MRLFLLTTLTMIAFAANSILNRLAVDSGAIDPASFAIVRVLSGAVVLVALVLLRGRRVPLRRPRRLIGAGSLTLYMIGFSWGYLTLEAGLGALFLFGVVQLSIFAMATIGGAPPLQRQLAGAAIAFAGLAWVLWPEGPVEVDYKGLTLMLLAGIGWAVYTMEGRGETDALAGTAANFCVALPLVAVAALAMPVATMMTGQGLGLAVISGAVTSGMGYALWYSLVPKYAPSLVAIIQLAVPVIALVAGILLLGEQASVRLVLGTAVILGGIALAVGRKRASGRKRATST
ncbi:DMT family transporter [Sedimentitalea todarodis]|uniref:DMT family transporter n=1 Tax=Sedimentitalea todarodis TaxID=1631240 RepID=A0ABU3VHP4_9RHOB|nr:DMT family transporter [Sedimentitalea todarodis]MDU9005685.1 DMT family transporter [Sedimentitalea todarodis]